MPPQIRTEFPAVLPQYDAMTFTAIRRSFDGPLRRKETYKRSALRQIRRGVPFGPNAANRCACGRLLTRRLDQRKASANEPALASRAFRGTTDKKAPAESLGRPEDATGRRAPGPSRQSDVQNAGRCRRREAGRMLRSVRGRERGREEGGRE